MESKEYFENVMQDYNQKRNGRSLRKYCKDEAIDYNWVIEYKKNYPPDDKKQFGQPQDAFIPVTVNDEAPAPKAWQVSTLLLTSPDGVQVELKSTNLSVVADILLKMSQP